MHAKVTGIPFGPGEFVEFREPNAAGYGDPLLRAPLVREDVLDDFTTLELARDAYGVVFADERTLEIDEEATTRLREELKERPRFTSLTAYHEERGCLVLRALLPGGQRAVRHGLTCGPYGRRRPGEARARTCLHAGPRVRKAYEQVADQLRELIVRGELRPGDRLPVESALARDFGVSRATVREALRLLTAQSLVRTEKGGGRQLRDAADGGDDLVARARQRRTAGRDAHRHARGAARGAGAGRGAGGAVAARRRSAEDLERLRTTVPGDGVDSTLEEFAHNAEFHSCSRREPQHAPRGVRPADLLGAPDALARSALGRRFHRSIHEHHHRILAAVDAGDADLAAAEMHEHLAFLRPYYEKAWKRVDAARPRG